MKKLSLLVMLGFLPLVLRFQLKQLLQQQQLTPLPAKAYVGKYKVKEGPFEELIISIQKGQLFGEAVGQGSAVLAPTKEAHIFEVVGYDGTIEFVKNDTKVVVKAKLTMQGNVIEAEKQP